ncbi:MAG: TIGR02281 family clan AA aspartic protease [Hyphomicrobiaceae bacterium]|nr:TIGR02281 family clan AA aspartic protease [Hyphomicrobiaceae bacterium]MCC0025262.1 TIGR02281 family clan AA aspartic protease [Hyphomicrobiaceae bacterium]
MIVVLIGLAVAAGLALLVSFDAGSVLGLDQGRMSQFLFLAVILVVLGSSLLVRRLNASQVVRGAVAWLLVFLVAIGGYAYRNEFQGFAGRVWGELVPSHGVVSDNGHTVSFQRGLGRSFEVLASVNGADVRMIFDTGANAVVLTHIDAERAGISLSGLQFNTPVQTANGIGRAARVTISDMQIGGIVRRNIPAFVADVGALDTSLLGMSFLETLDSYRVSQDLLELKG